MKELISVYIMDTKAATAVEYGIIAAAIAGVIVAGVFFFGESVAERISSLADAI